MLCNFVVFTLRHRCSPVNLVHPFRTPFPKNTFGGMLLDIISYVSILLPEKVLTFTATQKISEHCYPENGKHSDDKSLGVSA